MFSSVGRKAGVLAAAAGIGLVLLFYLFRTPSGERIRPVTPAPFAKEVLLLRLEDGTPLEEVVELPVGEGFYVSPAIRPGEQIPSTFEEQKVTEPTTWLTSLVFYPRGSTPDSEEAVQRVCLRFRRIDASGRIEAVPPQGRQIMVGNASPYGPSGLPRGRYAQPAPPKDWPQDQVRYWTWFGLPKASPGEYVYELRLFPTATWVSSVRWQIGEPVVLKRGLLRLVATARNPHVP